MQRLWISSFLVWTSSYAFISWFSRYQTIIKKTILISNIIKISFIPIYNRLFMYTLLNNNFHIFIIFFTLFFICNDIIIVKIRWKLINNKFNIYILLNIILTFLFHQVYLFLVFILNLLDHIHVNISSPFPVFFLI